MDEEQRLQLEKVVEELIKTKIEIKEMQIQLDSMQQDNSGKLGE